MDAARFSIQYRCMVANIVELKRSTHEIACEMTKKDVATAWIYQHQFDDDAQRMNCSLSNRRHRLARPHRNSNNSSANKDIPLPNNGTLNSCEKSIAFVTFRFDYNALRRRESDTSSFIRLTTLVSREICCTK